MADAESSEDVRKRIMNEKRMAGELLAIHTALTSRLPCAFRPSIQRACVQGLRQQARCEDSDWLMLIMLIQ